MKGTIEYPLIVGGGEQHDLCDLTVVYRYHPPVKQTPDCPGLPACIEFLHIWDSEGRDRDGYLSDQDVANDMAVYCMEDARAKLAAVAERDAAMAEDGRSR